MSGLSNPDHQLLLLALIAIPFAAGFLGLFHNIAAGGHGRNRSV